VILDSSALVAIVMQEPGAGILLAKIHAAPTRGIGTPTLLETLMVLATRLRGDPSVLLQALLRELEVEVIPFTEEHSLLALSAFLKYGKGRHKAALNFGDCTAYAVAFVGGEPLLFVGSDFGKTDIAAA
jgi:ribonuclease VapC